MSLQRKLVAAVAALALTTLTAAALTAWITHRWHQSKEMLEAHYQRSLLVEGIRAATFHAFKEVPDAVTGDDPGSRDEFEAYIAPAFAHFTSWRALAHSDDERAQVAAVQAAHAALVEDAREAFTLVESGRRREASVLMEGRLEDRGFAGFRRLTEAAVASDRVQRELVREQSRRTRRSAQVVLALVAFSAISLVLLLAAWLSSDLMRPLRGVAGALDGIARGDLATRLDAVGSDEIGDLQRAFNRAADALAMRRDGPATDRADPHRDASTGLQRRRVGVHALLQDALLGTAPMLAARAVSLDVRLSPTVDAGSLDPDRVRMAMAVLLADALAALPPRGGSLGVRTSLAPGNVLLVEVVDDGAPVRGAEDVDAHAAARQAVLAEVEDIAGRHGGRLAVVRDARLGTCRRLQLPLGD